MSHSFEQFYQAIRRCYRFGQKRDVRVHIISSELEGAVVDNLQRKEAQAAEMGDEMALHMRETLRAEMREASTREAHGEPDKPISIPSWLVGAP